MVARRLFHSFEADSISDALRRPIRQTTVIMLISDTPKVENMLTTDDVVLNVLVVLTVLNIDDSKSLSSYAPYLPYLISLLSFLQSINTFLSSSADDLINNFSRKPFYTFVTDQHTNIMLRGIRREERRHLQTLCSGLIHSMKTFIAVRLHYIAMAISRWHHYELR
jgi:hypothetical protein